MWCIVGLGNPGEGYTNTRHNIGFKILDALAQQYHISAYGSKFQAECFKGPIDSHPCVCLKPQTFMNLSGQSVGEASRYFKIPVEQILVIHDDIDLEFGVIKTKMGGGHAGHNGLKSIDQHVGKNYYRLRVGIGRPVGRQDVSDFVLDPFSKKEQQDIDLMIAHIVELFPALLDNNMDAFLQEYTKRMVL